MCLAVLMKNYAAGGEKDINGRRCIKPAGRAKNILKRLVPAYTSSEEDICLFSQPSFYKTHGGADNIESKTDILI